MENEAAAVEEAAVGRKILGCEIKARSDIRGGEIKARSRQDRTSAAARSSARSPLALEMSMRDGSSAAASPSCAAFDASVTMECK